MPKIAFETKEHYWTRTGKCNRCPGIHPAPCCLDCPHLEIIDGINTCLIYKTRDQECEECKVLLGKEGKSYTHKVCIDFPNHPFLHCLPQCSYNFTKKIK